MNTPNYPPPGQQPPGGQPPQGPQGPYGQPQGGQPPYGQRPPQTPPGGQPYGGQSPQTPPGGQPYGGQPPQTPPGGQSFGGTPPQGQPGGPGYPAAPSGAAPSGAPASKPGGNKVLKIVIGLVVAALVVGGVLWFNRNSASNAEVGDCIKVNSAEANDADVEKIDCATDEGIYQVGAKLDSTTGDCPSEYYDKYTQTGDGSDFTLCLMLNLDKGDCINGIEEAGKVVVADCASAEAAVVEALDSADESACPEGSGPLVYPEPSPGRTLCLGPAQAA